MQLRSELRATRVQILAAARRLFHYFGIGEEEAVSTLSGPPPAPRSRRRFRDLNNLGEPRYYGQEFRPYQFLPEVAASTRKRSSGRSKAYDGPRDEAHRRSRPDVESLTRRTA